MNLASLATGAVTATSLTAGTGNITFDQTGTQTLLVTNASVTTGAGAITITNNAATTITAASTTNGNIDVTTTSGNLTLTTLTAGGSGNITASTVTSGNITVDVLTADASTVTITSAGTINEAAAGDAAADINVGSGTIDLNAASGIGNTLAIELTGKSISADTTTGAIDLNSLATAGTGTVTVSSLTTSVGTIRLDQTGNEALTISSATTTNGSIDFTNTGDATTDRLILANIVAGGSSNVTATTFTSGNIFVGSITADANSVTLTSASSINDEAVDATNDINVGSGTVTLSAITGIGNTADLEFTASSISAVTTNGNIDLNSQAGAATGSVTATNLQTGTGSISLDQTGNEALIVTSATTGNGSISVTNVGNAAADSLTLNTIVAGGSGSITATTTTRGDILIQSLTADANTITVTSADAINEFSAADAGVDINVGSGTIDLNAVTGIGNTSAVELSGKSISADTTSGAIDLNNVANASTGSVTVSSLSTAAGNVTFDQTGSQSLTVTSATIVNGVGDLLITNDAATIITTASTNDGDITATITGGNLTLTTLTAGGSGDITASTLTSGSIDLDSLTADANTVMLTSAGSINEMGADGAADIVVGSGTIDLNAASGIGNTSAIELTGKLISADTTTGAIDLNSFSTAGTGAVTVSSLSTAAGNVRFDQAGGQTLTVTSATITGGAGNLIVTNDNATTITTASTNSGSITVIASGGNLTLNSLTAGGPGNISGTTLTSGNILVGSLTADANTVTLTSVGAINDDAADTLADITVGSGSIDLNAVTGIGNTAALELSGTTISADNSTAGNVQLSNFSAADVTVTSLTTVGSNITFDQTGGGDLTLTGAVTSGSGIVNGGDILITSTGALTAVNTASISTAGGTGGTLTVHETILDGPNFLVGAGDITLRGDSGDTIIRSDVSTATTITLTADRDVIIGAQIATSAADADIIIRADEDNDGSGGLLVEAIGQINSGRDVIAAGSDVSSTTTLVDAINVAADATADQIVAARDVTLTTQAAAPVTADVLLGGAVTATTGTIDVTAKDTIQVNDDITAGTDVELNSAVILTNSVTVTAGGNATFQGSINDDGSSGTTSNLTANVAGVTRFNGAIGNSAAIDSLTTDASGSTQLEGNITTSKGGSTFNDAVLLTNSVVVTDQSTTGITFNSTVDSEATEFRDLTLTTTQGKVVFDGDLGAGNSGGNQSLGKLVVTDATNVTFGNNDGVQTIRTNDLIDLGRNSTIGSGIIIDGVANPTVITTTNDNVRFNGAVTLNTDLRIDTGAGAGDITFTNDASINSQSGETNDLVLNAGTGKVSFNEDLGAAQQLGLLTIENAQQVVFGGADTETPGSGSTGPVNSVRTNDAINIGSQSVITGGIVLNGGATPLVMTTTNDNVRLNGAVTLGSDTRIDTGEGFGDITFTNDTPINSQTGETNDLVLNAGLGDVLFNEDIGATQRIGSLIVENADQVIFGETNTETIGAGTTGPVNVVNTNEAIDLGSQSVITKGVLLNGGTTSLIISTTGDSVRLNGQVSLQTDVIIDTNSNGAEGGAIVFTNDAPIDSDIGELNDLTLDAGTASITFNENLGAGQALGALTVQRADAGVTFGGADTETVGTGGSGPVNVINTTEAIDIGSGSNVIGGTGIVLNGGASPFFINTTGDAVRFNGAVTLGTNLVLDTDSTDNNTQGGSLTFTNDAPLNSQAGEHNNLVLDVGTASVTFNENIGETTSIGAMTINEADAGVIFGGADAETAGTGGSGPVNIVNTDRAVDLGVGTNFIGGAGIVFNGGAGSLVLTTTGDDLRLNGAITLRSHTVLSTGATVGGNVTFTNDTPIDSQAGELNDLTITAGLGAVMFNEDLGANQNLGKVTITRADAGVTFGQADTEVVGSGTIGPVDVIRANNGLIVGSTNPITGGIILDPSGSNLMLISSGGDIRFNGEVDLRATNVEISTDANLVGDIVFENGLTPQGNEITDLKLTSGLGDVIINGQLGTTTNRFDDILITVARDVIIKGAVETTTFKQEAGTGETRFESTLRTNDATAAGIDINTGKITFLDDVTTTGDGRVFLTNSDTLTIGANAPFSANGTFIQDGKGAVVIQSNLTTTNDLIQFSPTNDNSEDLNAAASITLADGTQINTQGTAAIRMKAVGNIALSQLLTSSVSGTVSVQSVSGAISDNTAGESMNVVAQTVALRAAMGIGDDASAIDPALAANNSNLPSAASPNVPNADIDIQVSTVAGRNKSSGDVILSNSTGKLLTIGTVDGVSGLTNTDDTPGAKFETLSGGVLWVTNQSPISVSSSGTPNANEGVFNSAGGSIILTAAGGATSKDATVNTGDDIGVFAPVAATRGTGSVLLNAGDDLTLRAQVLTAVNPFSTSLPTRAGNVDLNAGDVLTITRGTATFDIQTGTYVIDGTTPIDGSLTATDVQTNRQIRYSQAGAPVLQNAPMLATNVVLNGTTGSTTLAQNSGVVSGQDQTITFTGGTTVTIPGLTPLLIPQTFVGPQISSKGFAQISGSFARPGEYNFRILVSWGDDTFSYHHLLGDGDALPADPIGDIDADNVQPLDDPTGITTARRFYFEHFYNANNQPDPENPSDPIEILVFLQGDPNVVQVDSQDKIVATSLDGLLKDPVTNQPEAPSNESFLNGKSQFLISDLFADALDDANLGIGGTGLGARVDTIRASDTANQQDSSIQPQNFNREALPNPFFGFAGTPPLPAIFDFELENVLKQIDPFSNLAATIDGQPNTSTTNLFVKVPGTGIDKGASAIPFETKVDVPQLAFPSIFGAGEVQQFNNQPLEDSTNQFVDTSSSEQQAGDERTVILEVLDPNGNPQKDAKGRPIEIPLKEDVLDDLPTRIYRKLPDGRYRIYLREAGETRKRLILEVNIRDGKPADEASTTRDRPPTQQKKPMPQPKDPHEEARLEAAPVAEQAVALAESAHDEAQLAAQQVTADEAWARWEHSLHKPAQIEIPAAEVDDSTGDAPDIAVSNATTNAAGPLHPAAASALAAVALLALQRKHGDWTNRVDDVMTQWQKDSRKPR